MKILFLARRFYPDIGGVEKHIAELNKILLKKKHTITVIAELSRDDTKNVSNGKPMDVDGARVFKIHAGKQDWFKKFRIWQEMWRLRNLLNEADVIHCHDVFFWYLPFRFFFPNKQVFVTFHGYEGYPISTRAKIMRKISEYLSMGNICIGDFIQKWYGTKPTYVSYGAVTMPKQISDTIMKKHSALFIGRLDDQTGITTYIDSYKILKKHIKNFTLLTIGDGSLETILPKDVEHKGFQKNPEKYYGQYHFAFVSRYLTILEAFAAKRLVFAVYDNPVKEDYLKLAPYAKNIIIEKDPNILAKKVQYYLDHPAEEKKLVTAAYTWVQKQTWDNMVMLYLRLWQKKV